MTSTATKPNAYVGTMPIGRDGKPQVHHRPKALRVLNPRWVDESWIDSWPPFVPPGWFPRLDVPATRADCPPDRATFPCQHVRCRHHLWLVEGCERPGRRTAQVQREGDGRFMPEGATTKRIELKSILRIASPEACELDVVERNPDGLDYRTIGKLVGLHEERVRQICVENQGKLKPAIAESIGDER